MTKIVLDASVTAGWLLDDERGPLSLLALETVRRDGARVPRHWIFEVANSLLFAERRGRLRLGRSLFHLQSLNNLPIEVDDLTDLAATLSLAKEYDLTFYDALYLELALRRGLPLATLDDDLAQASRGAGVAVVA